jgi:hypothetical protein
MLGYYYIHLDFPDFLNIATLFPEGDIKYYGFWWNLYTNDKIKNKRLLTCINEGTSLDDIIYIYEKCPVTIYDTAIVFLSVKISEDTSLIVKHTSGVQYNTEYKELLSFDYSYGTLLHDFILNYINQIKNSTKNENLKNNIEETVVYYE